VLLQDTSDPNSDGLVLDESPLGGAQLKPGATVTLTVGRFAAGGTTTATTTTTP
jgi:beta-lactam-binding protein with PASTA domain